MYVGFGGVPPWGFRHRFLLKSILGKPLCRNSHVLLRMTSQAHGHHECSLLPLATILISDELIFGQRMPPTCILSVCWQGRLDGCGGTDRQACLHGWAYAAVCKGVSPRKGDKSPKEFSVLSVLSVQSVFKKKKAQVEFLSLVVLLRYRYFYSITY